ncbi:MAG: GFA family protein [Hyphomonadaceae bacterium]|nr:GFA family protein [Hyphomonadaceae bacterium]
MPLYHGSCHCGAIRFEIAAEIKELTQCDCSLCRKKNALMCAVHESAFKLQQGESALSLYQWNTRIARHYFCNVCGIYTFHRKRSMPDHYGVNVRCLDDFDPATAHVRQAEGKSMSVVDADARPEWKGPRA